MSSDPNFTNALKTLEQNRVDALKWIVECCNKDLDFNDIDITVKPKRDIGHDGRRQE